MRILINFIFYFILISSVHSQCKSPIDSQNDNCSSYYDKGLKRNIYITVNQQPEYNNSLGEIAFHRLLLGDLTEEIEEITPSCIEAGVSPKLTCRLIIDKNGIPLSFKISNKDEKLIKLIKNAERVVLNRSIKWTPAKCNGDSVACLVNMVIRVPIHEL